MRQFITRSFLCLSIAITAQSLAADPAEQASSILPPPSAITKQLKTSLEQVRPSCVSVFAKGYGSGVIISEDGLVLTAAHMMRHIKEQDESTLKITLHDGRKAEAKLLGYNRETDYALLQITSPPDTKWPHCKLAKTSSLTGDFCFTFAHPSGILKGRPAQVRLGRITSHSIQRDKPLYLFADCNIQPGDSGGPLFSMNGELIGIDSSAASLLGLNIFPAIDQFHLDRKRLLQSDRWGDQELAPDGPAITKVSLNREALEAIQKEFMRRATLKFPPTVDLLHSLVNEQGEVKLDQQVMVDHMTREGVAISRNQPIEFGLDDPALVSKLPALPNEAVTGVPLIINQQRVGYAIAIAPSHLLTKASLIKGKKDVVIRIGAKKVPVSVALTNSEWDLALLKVNTPTQLSIVKWPEHHPNVAAGDLLLARDHRGRMLWNISTDESRIVAKKRSIGPVKDGSIISKHRAPYPEAVRHALPLIAKDAGTPVFDESGQLAGMHIARFSRTMGLMIPTHILQQQAESMLKQSKITTELAPTSEP